MSWSRTLLNCHMFPNTNANIQNLKIAMWKASCDCGSLAYQYIHFIFTLRDPKFFGSLADLFIPLPVNFVYFRFTSRPTIAQYSFDISKFLLLVAFLSQIQSHTCIFVICIWVTNTHDLLMKISWIFKNFGLDRWWIMITQMGISLGIMNFYTLCTTLYGLKRPKVKRTVF